jgi:integrase
VARDDDGPETPLLLAVGGRDVGHPLTTNGLRLVLEDIALRARLPEHVPVNPHTFRHSFAFHYMRQPGADVLKLSRLMGHARLVTTEQYLRGFGAREARTGVSVLDALRRGGRDARHGGDGQRV